MRRHADEMRRGWVHGGRDVLPMGGVQGAEVRPDRVAQVLHGYGELAAARLSARTGDVSGPDGEGWRLLYRDDQMLGVIEADRVARSSVRVLEQIDRAITEAGGVAPV